MQFDFLLRLKRVLTWATIVSVTSASTRSRTPLFDQSVPIEQYTDTWVVQLLLPQSQLTLEAHTLATKHGLINQGKVEQINCDPLLDLDLLHSTLRCTLFIRFKAPQSMGCLNDSCVDYVLTSVKVKM